MPRRRSAALRAGLLGLSLLLALTGSAFAEPTLEQRGELVFNVGGCTNCHTLTGGPLLAGGGALHTVFGTFYAPNITPDPETGIGRWTYDEFAMALREGRRPDGQPYYPIFPYVSFTSLTDDDLRALKAYLDTIPPIRRVSRAPEASDLLPERAAVASWKAKFFASSRFEPDLGRSATWNRGAYLAEGPGHCQECHTPRDASGGLDRSRAYAGAPGLTTGRKAPNITSDPKKGIGRWSDGDLKTALTLGMLPDGDFVGGEMAKVVDNATAKLPPDDLDALVTYIRALPAQP